jgi:single-strand DNA-binding protein
MHTNMNELDEHEEETARPRGLPPRLPNLNKVIIIGNLTRDPELRHTQAGVPVANFRIASNRRYRDGAGGWREDVCYIGVVAWQRLAEVCSEHIRKGSAVMVEGELQSRTWESDHGDRRSQVEIRAHRVQFLDRRRFDEEDAETGTDYGD